VNDEKDYCFNDLKCGSGNFDSHAICCRCTATLYAQKQDIDCCQSERLGLDEQIWTQVNQETGIAIGVD